MDHQQLEGVPPSTSGEQPEHHTGGEHQDSHEEDTTPGTDYSPETVKESRNNSNTSLVLKTESISEDTGAQGAERKPSVWLFGRKKSNPQQDDNSSREMPSYGLVPFWHLYKYADRFDLISQVLGMIGAAGNGVIFPIFTIVFGEIINNIAFNYYVTQDTSALTESVKTTVPKFMYLGVGGMVAAWLQVYFLIYSSIRQTNRIRQEYLRKVLKQEIGYFDTTGTSGELMQAINEDCQKVQMAIGEKMSMFLFMISTAISGIVIGA